MPKNSRLDQELRQQEIEDGVKRLFTRWMITVCRTSTVAVLGVASYIGAWIVDHSDRVMKAMDALFGGGK